MLLPIRGSGVEEVGRALRTGKDCSFTGGTGTGSGSDCMGALSPSGPSGPSESSTASNRVGCASTRRGVLGVRGSRPAGVLGPELAERFATGGGFALDASSHHQTFDVPARTGVKFTWLF